MLRKRAAHKRKGKKKGRITLDYEWWSPDEIFLDIQIPVLDFMHCIQAVLVSISKYRLEDPLYRASQI